MSLWSRIAEILQRAGKSISEFLEELIKPRAPERSIAFTIGMIALAAKMAKADGVVTGEEVAAFKRIFQVQPDELGNVARIFNLAKQDVAGYDTYARQIARLFKGKPAILEDVLDGLFVVAKADGVVHERELAYLTSVAEIFGFGEDGFRRIRARHVSLPADDPYILLGIDPGAGDDEVKKAYRKLVREYHPDRHIANGMPAEAVRIATERLAEFNAAYDKIARMRGL